ncbi:hypothetical protein DU506_01635 [Vreelandella rituensis]|uniref:Uncharacterized protein n=1 Tax=Vreelandella rituensis TaxID=2282306 RepID=A0A368UB24_9GAMM|nr:hypothetical protein DU506_01635 [Halomonas rituensis]
MGVAIDWYAERRCGARYAGFCIPRTHETEGMAAPESVTHRHLLHMRGDNPRASTITEHSPRLRVCHRLDLRELAKTDGRAISDAKIAWAVALLCEQEAILPCHDPMGASTGESHLAQENLHGDFGLPDSNTASHPEHIAGWHTISSIRCSASLETITHAYRFIGFTAAEQQAVNERMIAANFPRQRRAA